MNIAILLDIHRNYTALRAVLADIEYRHVDQILCLGDVAASGPQPHECVPRLGEIRGCWVGVELCRVPLDVAAAMRAIHASGMPRADTWSADWP